MSRTSTPPWSHDDGAFRDWVKSLDIDLECPWPRQMSRTQEKTNAERTRSSGSLPLTTQLLKSSQLLDKERPIPAVPTAISSGSSKKEKTELSTLKDTSNSSKERDSLLCEDSLHAPIGSDEEEAPKKRKTTARSWSRVPTTSKFKTVDDRNNRNVEGDHLLCSTCAAQRYGLKFTDDLYESDDVVEDSDELTELLDESD